MIMVPQMSDCKASPASPSSSVGLLVKKVETREIAGFSYHTGPKNLDWGIPTSNEALFKAHDKKTCEMHGIELYFLHLDTKVSWVDILFEGLQASRHGWGLSNFIAQEARCSKPTKISQSAVLRWLRFRFRCRSWSFPQKKMCSL